MRSVEENIAEIFSLYKRYGNEHYGEDVTQLMHMIQAAKLALEEGCDEEMILSAFFHDIGHLLEADGMDAFGKKDHDTLGASYLLEKGFSSRVATLVESHVDTKRYLTYSDPEYYNSLSEASKHTLTFQGGPMSATEAAAYEKHPLFREFIRIRFWDDQAKITGIPVTEKDLEMIIQMTRDYLNRQIPS